MKISRFHPVYLKKGKTNLQGTRGKKGVYLIKEDNKLVYVGHSTSDLYKTITRHFQSWDDKQYRTTYARRMSRHRYTVRVVILQSPEKIENLERALILKHQPRDNQIKYDLFSKPTPKMAKVKAEYEDAISSGEFIPGKVLDPAPF